MSEEAAERKIAQLEGELVACQELLFGVLLEAGGPVVIDVDELRDVLSKETHMIDAVLNTDEGIVTCQILEIRESNEQ